jgi:hypothetical protein
MLEFADPREQPVAAHPSPLGIDSVARSLARFLAVTCGTAARPKVFG